MIKTYILLSALLFALISPSFCQDKKDVKLKDVTVEGKQPPEAKDELSADELKSTRTTSIADAVVKMPGLSVVQRGAGGGEPVIRGLGWERVRTQIGCLPIFGACPARMDPPAAYVSPESVSSIEIVKALPSVTLGPGGTAGRLIIEPDFDRGESPGKSVEGEVGTTWDDGRDGHTATARVQGGTDRVDVRATFEQSRLNNYKSAGGLTVPANMNEKSASFAFGHRPISGHRLYGSMMWKEETEVDFPALPMDIDESTAIMNLLGYRWHPEGKIVEQFEFSGGRAHVDHVMSNKRKPNRAMLEAETLSEALSYSAKLAADLRMTPSALLTTGVDAEWLERDAMRTRRIVASGMVFQDHIWPDVSRDIYGLFGELNVDASETVALRLGLRTDFVNSEADASPSTLNLYELYNGSDARRDNTDDLLISGNLRAEWQLADSVMIYGGGGRVVRAPSVTEQYFAFAPAPGGYQVGNPALDPEEKLEVTAGTVWQGTAGSIELSAFFEEVNNYIYPTLLTRTDVNGDGNDDNIRGFRNVDAQLYGGELMANLNLSSSWKLPVSLAYVAGRNTTDDRDLPEIPPFGGMAAIRYDAGGNRPWWLETGIRFAAQQDRIDEAFPEDETAAYSVCHLRSGVTLGKGIILEAGVENIFDEDYNDHLTREAMMPAGDLVSGNEIPGQGRTYHISLKILF